MNKYIPADKLVAEIERRIGICKRVTGDERNEEDMRRYYQGKVVALEEIRHLAASLQEEQPEVELEKEIEKQIRSIFYDLDGIAIVGTSKYASVEDMEYIASHFYELGLNTRKEE